LNTQQQVLVEAFLHHHDRHERLAAIVERARRRPHFSAAEKTPQNRVQGCSSSVWLISRLEDGECRFRSDADSPVVRGLVALITDFFAGSTPPEIVACPIDPLEVLDVNRGLTPTRRHGLAAVRSAIQTFARSHMDDSISQRANTHSDPEQPR
jgi:cysteine desulfuration protein SufE